MLEQHIVVDTTSYDSESPYDLIQANIDYLNALFGEYVNYDEVPPAALQSYFVDYYLAQVSNGGLAQFTFNSGMNGDILSPIYEGLKAMQLKQHTALFEQFLTVFDEQTDEQLDTFAASPLWEETETKIALNALNNQFWLIQEDEDILTNNHQWLRSQKQLLKLDSSQIEERVTLIASTIPDLDARKQADDGEPPRYFQLIDALCAQAGQTLTQITAGDPCTEYKGEEVLGWYFVTDKGLYYMVETEDEAVMIDEQSNEVVARLTFDTDLPTTQSEPQTV